MNDTWRGKKMSNLAMLEKLERGEALSVRDEGEPLPVGIGLFRLRRFVEDVDYCDPETESWIWSIGRDYETGQITASTGTEFYGNPMCECLFLR